MGIGVTNNILERFKILKKMNNKEKVTNFVNFVNDLRTNSQVGSRLIIGYHKKLWFLYIENDKVKIDRDNIIRDFLRCIEKSHKPFYCRLGKHSSDFVFTIMEDFESEEVKFFTIKGNGKNEYELFNDMWLRERLEKENLRTFKSMKSVRQYFDTHTKYHKSVLTNDINRTLEIILEYFLMFHKSLP